MFFAITLSFNVASSTAAVRFFRKFKLFLLFEALSGWEVNAARETPGVFNVTLQNISLYCVILSLKFSSIIFSLIYRHLLTYIRAKWKMTRSNARICYEKSTCLLSLYLHASLAPRLLWASAYKIIFRCHDK